MAALSATNSATPSLQTSLIRSRLAAARREAEQAQANEDRLRQQVSEAESQTQQSQDKVRSLSSQANQATQTASTYTSRTKPSQAVAQGKTQTWLSGLHNAISAQQNAADSGLQTRINTPLMSYAQGKTTGRILNLSA
ncbi:MAG: hypothetical protein FD135_650 [Comamonadaceae bacterium]|nr:MAG: hypothetical protein FD135_650 [Comamonadaceae bacterium]